MSTITKQWLQQTIAEMEATRDDIPFGLGEDGTNTLAAFRIALASLEAEGVGYVDAEYAELLKSGHIESCSVYAEPGEGCCPVYTAPPAPVAVPEAEPVAYIFKHPAGRLFWSLTDESNKGQRDVMPVYSAPVPAFVPPVIYPDYEVIKGILPTANPDEYACCIAADMWNACRAAMLQGAEPVSNRDELPDGWVACSERMPEVGVKVLCFPVNDEPIHATYNGQVWLQDISWSTSDEPIDNVISCNVFHWMPLPASP